MSDCNYHGDKACNCYSICRECGSYDHYTPDCKTPDRIQRYSVSPRAQAIAAEVKSLSDRFWSKVAKRKKLTSRPTSIDIADAAFNKWFKSFSFADWEDVNPEQAFLAGYKAAKKAARKRPARRMQKKR